MWRAVLRSMYSSALKPLTSAAILVSKRAVSKRVIWPTPETPSIMFDHTVSRSLPIGVMKPMPVTATRRPLELDVMDPSIGTAGPNHSGHRWQNWGLCLDSKSNFRANPRPTAACADRAPAEAGVEPVANPGLHSAARGAFPGGTGRCAGAGAVWTRLP